jgi:hypothetical protein
MTRPESLIVNMSQLVPVINEVPLDALFDTMSKFSTVVGPVAAFVHTHKLGSVKDRHQ